MYAKKAKQNISAAKICYENGLYDASANRMYYAAFHAAVAVLFKMGVKRDRIDHKWVQAEFSRLLIRRQKMFPAKFKSYLQRMQIVRNCADYSDENVSQKEALRQLHKAEEMVSALLQEISA